MKQHVLWLLVVLLIPSTDARAQRLPIKSYSTADGLASNSVNRIVRDSQGFLWFCTAGGLSRFDGYTFTNFGTLQGLPHPNVTDFLETRGHEYWVGTKAGLVHFDPRGSAESIAATGPSAHPPMFVLVEAADAQGASAVTVIKEGRNGTLWIGTEDGLYRLDSAGGQRLLRRVEIGILRENLQDRAVADVVEDRNGSLWVATLGGLYRRRPDGKVVRYGQRDGLPNEFLTNLLEDQQGRLWAGTRVGFFRFSAGDDRGFVVDLKFNSPDVPSTSPGQTWITQLFETSQHRFWLTTVKGLVEYLPAGDDHGRHFLSYATRNGLTDLELDTVTEDLSGNLWLGTSHAGAMKLANSGVRTYGQREGLYRVFAMFEDRANRLCFRASALGDARRSVFEGARLDLVNGTEPGYHTRFGCFDGEHFDWFTLGWGAGAQVQPGRQAAAEVADDVIGWVGEGVTLQGQNGEWWVGTGQGLFRFPASEMFSALRSSTPVAVYTTADGLGGWQVFRLFEDSHGNIWVSTIDYSTTNGLARWEPERQRLQDLANAPGLPSLKEDLARSFGEDRSGNVWIGFSNALVRYQNGTFTRFTNAEGLPPGHIKDIHVDQSGRIWLASDQSGLVRVDQGRAARPVFVKYTTAQGLSGNNLNVITEDRDGRIFVGGGSGLDRFDPATGNVKHFSVTDGLAAATFSAAFRDHHGALWFGTTEGLTRLAPEPESSRAPPPIWITALRGAGVSTAVSALGERELSLPDFAPDQRELQIDFVALSFAPGEVLRYQYRLEGAGADWSVPGEQRSITYASLSPGHYTFQVRAVDSDGMISPQPATVTFSILRPVWLRWWFLSLVACALTATVYGLYRYRVGRLLEVVNIRTRIASDLHDDVGANLTRIAVLSEVARAASGADAQDGPLGSIARIARESVSSMSDIVWAIKPERESLLDLTRRMRQHGEELFTLRHIEFRFDAPTHPRDNLTLGVGIRRDVLLIFKEAINNAARHSGCSSVEVGLRVEGSRLVMVIADNGHGFDASRQSEGQGLESMRRRCRNVNGEIEIASVIGSGTRVALSIPVTT